MKKIKTIEKEIVTFVDKNSPSPEAEAFKKTLAFWETYDALFQTNHAQTISFLYSHRSPSLVSASIKTCTSEQTLLRYRKRYVETFNYFLAKELVQSEAATD